MIETPADYRSFAFLGEVKIRSVRFARVSGVLLFYKLMFYLGVPLRQATGQAFALAFFHCSTALHNKKRAQTIAQSFTRNRAKKKIQVLYKTLPCLPLKFYFCTNTYGQLASCPYKQQHNEKNLNCSFCFSRRFC